MPKQPRTSANKGNRKQAKDSFADEDSIPYAVGFKPPTARESRNAIGFTAEIPLEFSPESDKKFEYFPPLPDPTNIDDWLAQYNEQGQTYRQFLKDCPWLSSRKRKYMSQEFLPSGQTIKEKYPNGKVYIVPVGDFEGCEKSANFFSHLKEFTSIFLGLPVESLPKIDLQIEDGKVYWIDEPKNNRNLTRRASQRTRRNQLKSRYNPETKHLQVCVDSNLMQLRNLIPEDAICMIGLTMLDLYGEDGDLFVAGMAAGNQRVAVFSLYRYDPCLSFSTEHWFQIQEDGDIPHAEQQRLILQRGCKLLVHEICHLLGVDHCIYYDCCMNGSGHLSEDFRQPMHLCPVDLHKLHRLVGFDVVKRYKSLLQYYKKHGFKEEEKWVGKRIKFICEWK